MSARSGLIPGGPGTPRPMAAVTPNSEPDLRFELRRSLTLFAMILVPILSLAALAH